MEAATLSAIYHETTCSEVIHSFGQIDGPDFSAPIIPSRNSKSNERVFQLFLSAIRNEFFSVIRQLFFRAESRYVKVLLQVIKLERRIEKVEKVFK